MSNYYGLVPVCYYTFPNFDVDAMLKLTGIGFAVG